MRRRQLTLVLSVLALAVGLVRAQMGETDAGVAVEQDGIPYGDCEVFELPSASWGAPTLSGSRCTLTPLGGGGGGVAVLLSFASCTPLDGNAQVYLGAGGCADPNEPIVQVRAKAAVTLTDLSCALSGSAGATPVVTVTARSGPCGGLSDSGVTCVANATETACSSGTASMAVTAGNCFALRVSSSAAFSSARAVNCTMRRSA